jgi:hypothetical protein
MAHRLSNRLADMAKTRAQQVHSVTGTDLVVLGRAAAVAAVRERYGELSPESRDDDFERRRNADLYRVGWDVAGSVAINAALNTDHQPHVQIEDAARQQQWEDEIIQKAEQILSARKQATAEAEERRREAEEAAASKQRLEEIIEAKLAQAKWQAILRRRQEEEQAAQSARKSDRISRVTTVIGFAVMACIIAICGGWVWH